MKARVAATLVLWGLGLGCVLMACWAAAAIARPPAWAIGLACLVVTLSRCLAGLASRDGRPAAAHTLTGLALGWASCLALTSWSPPVLGIVAAALGVVTLLWWQLGRLWAGLLALVAPPEAGPGARLQARALGAGVHNSSGLIATGWQELRHAATRGEQTIREQVETLAFSSLALSVGVAAAGVALAGARVNRPLLSAGLAAVTAAVMLLVARGMEQTLVQRARLVGARVLPGVGAGFAGAATGAVLLCTLVGALLPRYPRAFGPGGVLSLLGWLLHVPAVGPGGGPGRVAVIGGGAAGGGGGAPGALLVLIYPALLLVGVIVAIRIARSRMARAHGPRAPDVDWNLIAVLRAVLRAIWAMLSGLWGLAAPLTRPAAGARRAAAPGHWGAGEGGQGWLSAWRDPRHRVRRAYARLLVRAGQRGWRRPVAATPHAFGARLAPAVSRQAQDLAALTQLYTVARFSHHAIGAADATRAEAAGDAVARGLEHAGPGQP